MNNDSSKNNTGRIGNDSTGNTGRDNTGRMNGSTGRISPPAQEPSGGGARKKPHFVFKAADVTVELISSIFSTIFKVFGSILLIFIITGMLFACVFAYYVKTCLTPNLDLSLDDYKLNQSSTIYYQDAGGEWREVMTIGQNPSICDNLTHCFVAEGVEKVSGQHLDASEDIEVLLMSKAEVLDMLINDQQKQALMAAPLWRYFYTPK